MDNKLKNIIILIAISLLVVAGISYFLWTKENSPGKLDVFAQCLKEKGAAFYGAFWCSHCQNQKKVFGNSAKYLPYIECSTVDGKGQLQVCIDQKIDGYPTWRFSDSSMREGELTLKELADKSGCQLP